MGQRTHSLPVPDLMSRDLEPKPRHAVFFLSRALPSFGVVVRGKGPVYGAIALTYALACEVRAT